MGQHVKPHLINNKNYLTTAQLDTLQTSLNDILMIVVMNCYREITYANDLFCESLQLSRKELFEKNYRPFQSEYDVPAFYEQINDQITATGRWTGKLSLEDKKGVLFWTKTTILTVQAEDNECAQYVYLLHDISAQRQVEELTLAAYYDELTKLPNRRKLNRCLHSYILQASKKMSSFAVLFIDVDKLKMINDNYGHYIGDLFLIEVGQRLLTIFAEKKCVFRQSGDEFIIIYDDVEQVEKRAEEIIAAINAPFHLDSEVFQAHVSIGMSIFPDHSTDRHRLIDHADVAMFEAKEDRGSSYRMYKQALDGPYPLQSRTTQ